MSWYPGWGGGKGGMSCCPVCAFRGGGGEVSSTQSVRVGGEGGGGEVAFHCGWGWGGVGVWGFSV